MMHSCDGIIFELEEISSWRKEVTPAEYSKDKYIKPITRGMRWTNCTVESKGM